MVDPFYKQHSLVFLKHFDDDTNSFTTVFDMVVDKEQTMEEFLEAISKRHSAIKGEFDESKF